jgi:hypothetical protein
MNIFSLPKQSLLKQLYRNDVGNKVMGAKEVEKTLFFIEKAKTKTFHKVPFVLSSECKITT